VVILYASSGGRISNPPLHARLFKYDHWADFDAALSRNGDFRGDFDGFIKVFAVDDVEAGQTFAGFGKRTIGG